MCFLMGAGVDVRAHMKENILPLDTGPERECLILFSLEKK